MNFLKVLLLITTSSAFAVNSQLQSTEAKQFLGGKVPRNYIKNSGAERNISDVTDVPGTFVNRTTTNPIEGVAMFDLSAASSGDVAIFQAQDFQVGLMTRACEATFVYAGTTAGNFKAYVTLAGTTVSQELQLANTASSITSRQASLIFPCGSSTTDDPALRIESTSASGTLFIDSIYLGEAVSIGTVAQPEVVVHANRITSAQSISTTTPTTVIFNGENIDVYGEYNPSTGEFTAKRAGVYLFGVSVRVGSGTAGEAITAGVYKNGSQVTGCLGSTTSSTIVDSAAMPGCPVSAAIGDVFTIRSAFGSDAAYEIVNSNSSFVTIQRIPSSSEIVVRSDAPGADWTAFTPTVTHGSGSATNVTHAGWYRCNGGDLELKYQSTFSNTSAAFSVWYYGLPTNFAALTTVNNDNLGFARFDDAGTAAFGGVIRIDTSTRLLVQYQAISTHTGTAPLLANQNISNTLPFTWTTSDSFTAYARVPVTASSPCPKNAQPLIPGSVFSSSLGVERIERAKVATICSSNPCTITSQSGGFSSIGFNSTGNYTANFVSGTFSAAPTCKVQTNYLASGSFRNAIITTSPTTSSFTFTTFVTTTAGAENSGFEIICMGPR